jgi:hypothetical protein
MPKAFVIAKMTPNNYDVDSLYYCMGLPSAISITAQKLRIIAAISCLIIFSFSMQYERAVLMKGDVLFKIINNPIGKFFNAYTSAVNPISPAQLRISMSRYMSFGTYKGVLD